MNASVPVEFQLNQSIENRLDVLAGKLRRDRDVLVAEALNGYLHYQESQMRKTIEAIDTVNTQPDLLISEQEMDRWIDSLGSDNELPPPHLSQSIWAPVFFCNMASAIGQKHLSRLQKLSGLSPF